MKLNNPITINAQGSSLVVEELDLAIIDRPLRKVVVVKIHPLARPLVIWQKDQYDQAGDYTQTQLETRVLEILEANNDLQNNLQNLFNIELI